MRLKEIDAELKRLYLERSEMLKPYDEKLNQLQCLRTEIQNKMVDKNPTYEFLLEICDSNTKAYDLMFKKLPKGLMIAGYNYHVKQAGIQLYLTQCNYKVNEELAKHIEEKLLPVMKVKEIDILRHDCGEEGNWRLFKKDQWEIHKTSSYEYRQGSAKPEYRSNSLKDTLDYIATEHYGTE